MRTAYVAPLLLLITACSGGGHDGHGGAETTAAGGARVIDIDLTEMAMTPSQIDVTPGETVTLRFTNSGTVRHEAVLGDAAAQEEHEEQMATTGSMDEHMDHMGTMVTVEPGESAELTHTFDEPGELLLGCHQPGHWAAGMAATIQIS